MVLVFAGFLWFVSAARMRTLIAEKSKSTSYHKDKQGMKAVLCRCLSQLRRMRLRMRCCTILGSIRPADQPPADLFSVPHVAMPPPIALLEERPGRNAW